MKVLNKTIYKAFYLYDYELKEILLKDNKGMKFDIVLSSEYEFVIDLHNGDEHYSYDELINIISKYYNIDIIDISVISEDTFVVFF